MGRHRSDGIEWDYEGNGSSDDPFGDLDNTPPEGMSVEEIMQLAEERETETPSAVWPDSAEHEVTLLRNEDPMSEDPMSEGLMSTERPPDERPVAYDPDVPINEPMSSAEFVVLERDEPPRKRLALVAAGGAIIGAVALIATFAIGGDEKPVARSGGVPPGAADTVESPSPSTNPEPRVKEKSPDEDDPDTRPDDGSTRQPGDRKGDDRSDGRNDLPGNPGPNPSRRPDPSTSPSPRPTDPSVAPSPSPTDDDCFLFFC